MIEEKTMSAWSIPGLIVSKELTVEDIVDYVCEYFGVEKEDIIRKKHKKKFAFERFIAMYLINEFLFLKPADLAPIFKRDRTTAISALNVIRDFLDIKDEKTITALRDIKMMIKKNKN